MTAVARATSRRRAALGLLLAVVIALLAWWAQDDLRPDGDSSSGATSVESPSPTHDLTATTTPTVDPTTGPETDPESGLPVVRLADLPAVAREAVERIDRGGPFPYDEDDGVFENREELLPDRPRGHYREYTVGGRPGDRGPLRIVAGADDELYWTEDHYRSFSRIAR